MTGNFKCSLMLCRMFRNSIPLHCKFICSPSSWSWIINTYFWRKLKIVSNIQDFSTVFCSKRLTSFSLIIAENSIFFQHRTVFCFQDETCCTFWTCCRNNCYQTIIASCCCDFFARLRNIVICLRWIKMFKILAIYLDRNLWTCFT